MSAPDLSDLNATLVRVSTTGALWKAPLGTTLPVDADPFAALDPAFTNLGYISDDGVNEDYDDSVDDVVAWQNATTIRSTTSQSTASLGCMLMETKGTVLEAFHRGSTIVPVATGIWKMNIKPIVADPSIFILDAVDGLLYERTIVGNGEIVERGEVQNLASGAKGYPIVIRAYPDANGDLMVKYSNDNAWGYS